MFYGEAWSVVHFLVGTYGPDKMAKLLAAFNGSQSEDKAFTAAYGLDRDGVYNAWRKSVGLATVAVANATQAPPRASRRGARADGGGRLRRRLGRDAAARAGAGQRTLRQPLIQRHHDDGGPRGCGHRDLSCAAGDRRPRRTDAEQARRAAQIATPAGLRGTEPASVQRRLRLPAPLPPRARGDVGRRSVVKSALLGVSDQE